MRWYYRFLFFLVLVSILTHCQTEIIEVHVEAVAGESREIFVGETAFLDGTKSLFNRKENPVIFWELTLKPGPSNSAISSHNELEAFFIPDIPGEYKIRLTVTMNGKNSSDEIIITAKHKIEDLIKLTINQVHLNGSQGDLILSPPGEYLNSAAETVVYLPPGTPVALTYYVPEALPGTAVSHFSHFEGDLDASYPFTLTKEIVITAYFDIISPMEELITLTIIQDHHNESQGDLILTANSEYPGEYLNSEPISEFQVPVGTLISLDVYIPEAGQIEPVSILSHYEGIPGGSIPFELTEDLIITAHFDIAQ